MIGIYKIENLINHKVYIGKSINIKSRFNSHIKNLKNNKHINPHLQKSWNKYGPENFSFEVIEECSVEQLNDREIYWLNYYGSYLSSKNYNVIQAGSGGKGDEEWRQKISNSVKNHYINGDYNCRKKGTRNWITKENKCLHIKKSELDKYLIDGWKIGRPPRDEETKRKISLKVSGEKNGFYGKKHTEETRKKLHKKHNLSDDARKKLSILNSEKFKKLKWINNGSINKRVENYNIYLSKGWKLGRRSKI